MTVTHLNGQLPFCYVQRDVMSSLSLLQSHQVQPEMVVFRIDRL
jgi:hypothetical protein